MERKHFPVNLPSKGLPKRLKSDSVDVGLPVTLEYASASLLSAEMALKATRYPFLHSKNTESQLGKLS